MNRIYGTAIIFVILLGLVGWWKVAQWHECREMGHTKFYCIGHVSR